MGYPIMNVPSTQVHFQTPHNKQPQQSFDSYGEINSAGKQDNDLFQNDRLALLVILPFF